MRMMNESIADWTRTADQQPPRELADDEWLLGDWNYSLHLVRWSKWQKHWCGASKQTEIDPTHYMIIKMP